MEPQKLEELQRKADLFDRAVIALDGAIGKGCAPDGIGVVFACAEYRDAVKALPTDAFDRTNLSLSLVVMPELVRAWQQVCPNGRRQPLPEETTIEIQMLARHKWILHTSYESKDVREARSHFALLVDAEPNSHFRLVRKHTRLEVLK